MRVKRGGGEIPAKNRVVESEGTAEGFVEVGSSQEPDGIDDYFEMKFKQRGEAANLQD